MTDLQIKEEITHYDRNALHQMFFEWWQPVRKAISNCYRYEIHNLKDREAQQQIQQLEVLPSQHPPSNTPACTTAVPHHQYDSWFQP